MVAGLGGIGCPAAMGLVEAGVGHLTLVDPDLVQVHNLPRQVLYADEDVGRRKADVAARRLARPGVRLTPVAARLDARNAERLLDGADLLVDATDGARAKDTLNALAVGRGLPLIHAAGLRSEARLLDVPAHGRPCLACLFGRLGEEGGSCADLGVWNGVVGSVGFLAAEAAVRRLRTPGAPASGYEVLDLQGRRWTRLEARAVATCPVCSPGSRPLRGDEGLDDGHVEGLASGQPAPSGVLDLRTERCPLNLLRARQRLERAESGETVELWLGLEGAATVPDGLRALGHAVLVEEPHGEGLRLRVRRAWAPAADAPEPLRRELLERFARQIVLPDVGEQGLRRLQSTRVVVRGRPPGTQVLRTWLLAAGVGTVDVREGGSLAASVPGLGLAWAARFSPDGRLEVRRTSWIEPQHVPTSVSGVRAMLLGTLLADAVERAIVLGACPGDLVSPPPP